MDLNDVFGDDQALKEDVEAFPAAPKEYAPLNDATLNYLQDHITAFRATTGMHIDSSNLGLLQTNRLPMASIAGYLKKIHNSHIKADVMLVRGEMPGNAELWKNDYNLLFPKFWKEFVEFLHDKYKPTIAQTKYSDFVKNGGCWPPSTQDIREFNAKFKAAQASTSRGRQTGVPEENRTPQQNYIRYQRLAKKAAFEAMKAEMIMKDIADHNSTKYKETKETFDIQTNNTNNYMKKMNDYDVMRKEDKKAAAAAAAAGTEDEDEDENLEPNQDDEDDDEEEEEDDEEEQAVVDEDGGDEEQAVDEGQAVDEEQAVDGEQEVDEDEDGGEDEESDVPPPPPTRRVTRHSQVSQVSSQVSKGSKGSKRETAAAGTTPSAKRTRA